MVKNATPLLVWALLSAGGATHIAHAQTDSVTQPFTLTCLNNGGKSIYFSIDLASKKWALMKSNGQRDSGVQDVTSESEDIIKLKNPGGYFVINRKTGAMDLIKGESRKVDRISCRKRDSYMPFPEDKPPANKF